jgi:hypothetical protein
MVVVSLACHQKLFFPSMGYWHGMLGLVEEALVFLGILVLRDWKGYIIKLLSGRYDCFQLNARQ